MYREDGSLGARRLFVLSIVSALVGICTGLAVVGPGILDPRNVAFLQEGDRAQHYLGWALFAKSPPGPVAGSNLLLGYESGTTVVFTDSIPAFSIPAKWMTPSGSAGQFIGIWILLCFVLQAVFATLLLWSMTRDRVIALLGGILLLLAPPMLQRIPDHSALAGQWMVLAAILLYTRRASLAVAIGWVGLCGMAILVHAYLFTLVIGILAAFLIREILFDRRWSAGWIFPAVIGTTAALGWQAGYLQPGLSSESMGFGFYRADLLTYLDPRDWSSFLPRLPYDPAYDRGEYEGAAYLGLGGLLLSVLAMIGLWTKGRAVWSRDHMRRWAPLFVVAVGAFAFAVTPSASLGPFGMWTPIPDWAAWLPNTFRSSGRFSWILFYLVLILAFVTVHRAFSRRAAAAIALAVVVVQAVDLLPLLRSVSHATARQGSEWRTPLQSPIWDEIASSGQFRVVALLETQDSSPGLAEHYWLPFTYFALQAGLRSQVAYLARVNVAERTRARARHEQMIASGIYAPDSVFIVPEEMLPAVRRNWQPGSGRLVQADGFWVIVPAPGPR